MGSRSMSGKAWSWVGGKQPSCPSGEARLWTYSDVFLGCLLGL